eukprot:CAMPEP_0167786204 /NCGR_PEP_ID=MMETSP0111_2-20121227/8649_1 /TAXON_ID=91324 /ORGANISM="Lotharella globosa, Strain CCCM811" /LENGTH=275 /DNA_ID=CAMNT_0007677533 /DNA_START=125 /DNA_END=953 /DNA_ORIENTATION=-
MADLAKVVEREGLYAIKQWDDILSGGESQKVAMARVYYHQPDFAVLDEATSMVSATLEPRLYRQAQSLGITVVSIAHRVAVWKFHTHVLAYKPAKGIPGAFVAELKPLTPDVQKQLLAGYDVVGDAKEGAAAAGGGAGAESTAADDGSTKAPQSSSRLAYAREGSSLMKKAWSMQDLKKIPRAVLRGAYIGRDWRQLLRRNPEAPSNLLTPTSSILNLRGTAASMLDVDQQGDSNVGVRWWAACIHGHTAHRTMCANEQYMAAGSDGNNDMQGDD